MACRATQVVLRSTVLLVAIAAGCSAEAPAPPTRTTERPEAVAPETAVATVRPPAPIEPQPVVPTTPPILERIAVIGASASAGMGARMAIDRDGVVEMVPTDLARVLEASIDPPDVTVHDFADAFFFRAPHENGRRAVAGALEVDATLVVAVDFLFWFTYMDLGHVPALKRIDIRLDGLRAGLMLLEEIDVPILVGDIPNMAPAAGLMIRTSQVPSPAELERLNAAIELWAAIRDDVRVIPLGALIESIHARQPIALGGLDLSAEESARLLMRDRLHPTPNGLVALGQLVTDALRASPLDVPSDVLRLDRDSIIEELQMPESPGDHP